MKTFSEWFERCTFFECSVEYVAEEAWKACASEYNLIIENIQNSRRADESLHKHVLKNKDAAIQLKSDAFDLLKKKSADLESDLKTCLVSINHRDLKISELEKQVAEIKKHLDWATRNVEISFPREVYSAIGTRNLEIRQRHKLDEVKA